MTPFRETLFWAGAILLALAAVAVGLLRLDPMNHLPGERLPPHIKLAAWIVGIAVIAGIDSIVNSSILR